MAASHQVTGMRRNILLYVFLVGILIPISVGISEEGKPSRRVRTTAKTVARAAQQKQPAKKHRTAVLGKPGTGETGGGQATGRKRQSKATKPQSNANGVPKSKPQDTRSTVFGKLGTAGKRSNRRANKNAESPLGRLIKNIFGKSNNRPVAPIIPRRAGGKPANAKKPTRGDPTGLDAIDALAPYNPDQGRLLRRATVLIEEKNWKQALPLLKYLVDPRDPQGRRRERSDSLFRTEKGKWVSVVSKANRLLSGFPAEWLERLRLEVGAEAKQELLDAQSRGDIVAIAKIATRFFHTPAGQQAANLLGSYHFDRGEFERASHWFKQLMQVKAPLTKNRQWQVRGAFAFRRAGETAAGDRVLSEVASVGKTLDLGGMRIDPKSWLEKEASPVTLTPPRLTDWPIFMGTSSHTGSAVGGEPLLLPRWTSPTTHRRPLEERISILMEDLADQQRALLPATFPLMIDGKVIFRTLRGVQVVDADSGEFQWETRAGISAERLLSGEKPQQPQYREQMMWGGGFAGGAMFGNFGSPGNSGSKVDQQPLTSLLYRDGLNGILSSDGERLFVIEDHAILPSAINRNYGAWGGNATRNDPYRRDWSSNRISAYQLEGGRALWDVGGVKMNEPFDPLLAGTYFFGAPVPDGSDLLVVGEKEGEIRLYALDSATGLLQWSQLVAYSDTRIDKEYGRRLWTAQVGVGNGVVICPTTVGWLVAVDRLSHSVLWAYRYTRPSKNVNRKNRQAGMVFGGSQGPNQVQPDALNSRWTPSAPVIVGNSVVYAPSEDSSLVCLNLFDGSLKWKKSKSNFLYLAGVFGERVVLVGKSSIAAYALNDGKNLWNPMISIPSSDGPPSGIGIAADEQYHLPLQSGQLWTVDLQNGKILTKSFLPDGKLPLGNLSLYRGTLLSLTPLGMTSFEQRETVTAEIARKKAADPADAWALLREADIHILHRDYPQALSLLRKIPARNMSKDLQPRYRQSLIESLSEIVRSDFQKHDRELADLAKLVQSDSEKLLLSQLIAQNLLARKEYKAAFEVYWKLASDGRQSDSSRIARPDDPRISLQFQLWIAGKLKDLWSQMPENHRKELNLSIVKASHTALEGEISARERFETLFGFHPVALPVRRKLVEEYASQGNLSRAEILLLKLSRHPEAVEQAASLERLARLMADAGLKRDAEYYYRMLERDYSTVTLPDGRAIKAILGNRSTAAEPEAGRQVGSVGWNQFDLKLSRTGTAGYNYSSVPTQELAGSLSGLPFYENHRLTIGNQRLSIVKTADESLHWLLPLRSFSHSSQTNFSATRSMGHQLFVLHRDMLHCLSPVDRKVLWTNPVDNQIRSGGYYRQPSRQTPKPMQNAAAIGSQSSLAAQSSAYGMLAAVAGDYVCVYGRRRFVVLDASTGEVRWIRNRIKRGTKVIGCDDVIYVVPPNRSETVALRALDGKKMNVPKIAGLLSHAVRIFGNDLVLVEANSSSLFGLFRRKTIVRRYNPLSQQEQWKLELPNGTYLSLLENGSLATLTPSHQLELVNLDSGKLQTISDPIPEADLKSRGQLYVLSDQRNIYLAINKRRSRNNNYYGGSQLPSLQLNGPLIAFDIRSGQLLWKQDVRSQQLVYQQLRISPVLLFSKRSYERKNNLNYWKMELLAIDKKSGRRLLDAPMPMNNEFTSMNINLPDRYIELRSYNEIIRLEAVDKTTAAAPVSP
jgi:outer membrane protein assembly factor BamB